MRKLGLVTSLWAALLLFPLSGFALGLGEIEVSSYLNQPLKAEIEVISARPGEIDDLLISLASRDAFRKAGLERPNILSSLKFKVNKAEDGQTATVFVTTKTPVTEPFLSFLVEADWAKGRLLREFTVLLDPPSFAQQATPAAVVEPVTQPSSETEAAPVAATDTSAPLAEAEPAPATSQPIALTESTPAAAQASAASEPAENMSTPQAMPADQIVVQKGDTLWGIASQFKDDAHSMAQVMLAMQMANPEAFAQDNINNLKVGSVLRVPELNTLDSLSKQEAYAQVLEQNGLWDEYVARKSGNTSTASPTATTAGGAASAEGEDRLSLLAPGDGDSDTASLQTDSGSEDSGKIRKQLALAEEELEAARLENEDLTSRVKSLEEQLAKFEELQKMIQLQDDSLAQLQDNAASQAEQQAEAAPDMVMTEEIVVETDPATGEVDVTEIDVIEQAPDETMVEAADEIMAEQQAEATDEMLPEAGQATDEPLAAQESMSDDMASSEAETVLPTMPEEESPAVSVAPPVIITEAPDSMTDGGLMDLIPSVDDLLNDPVMLGGLGGVLALILGLVLLRRKKSGDDDNNGITVEDSASSNIDEDPTPIHVPSAETETSLDATEAIDDQTDIETNLLDTEQGMAETMVSEASDDEEDEFAKTAIISSDDIAATQETDSLPEEQDDVLNEVDVYLAYGLYENAEDLLKETLEEHPERAEYRAKLLDTYFATKNKDAFVKEAEILKSLGAAADRFWDRIQVMGFELAPENELFSGAKDSSVSVDELEFAKPETPDFDIGADDDSTDFSNTDFNLGEDTMDVSSTQVMDVDNASALDATQTIDDLDVEFPDLDEEEADQLNLDEVGEDASTDHEEDVELDLSAELDLSPDEEPDLNIEDNLDAEAESTGDSDLLDDQDDINFELPDENQDDEDEPSIIELEPTVEAPMSPDEIPAMADDEEDDIELDIAIDDDESNESPDSQLGEAELTSETLIVAPGELTGETDASESPSDVGIEEVALEEDLDFDMSAMDDSEMQEGEFSPSEDVALADVEIEEDDITEFRPAEMTGEFDAFSGAQDENESESAASEVDPNSGLDKTGTFAPGDFNEETGEVEAVKSEAVDDIEDLMLPDDVDEVSTKLDLAKAFIDMGDAEGARSSLEEVLNEGTEEQKAEATGLMEQIK